jgi:hypothetical protein
MPLMTDRLGGLALRGISYQRADGEPKSLADLGDARRPQLRDFRVTTRKSLGIFTNQD